MFTLVNVTRPVYNNIILDPNRYIAKDDDPIYENIEYFGNIPCIVHVTAKDINNLEYENRWHMQMHEQRCLFKKYTDDDLEKIILESHPQYVELT
eukprot:UN09158